MYSTRILITLYIRVNVVTDKSLLKEKSAEIFSKVIIRTETATNVNLDSLIWILHK